MSLIKLSFKKEHKLLLYSFGIQIVFSIILVFKNRFQKKLNINDKILDFFEFIGNFSLIFLYLFENKLSHRNKKNNNQNKIIPKITDNFIKHLDLINIKNAKQKFLKKNKKYILIFCIFFLRTIDCVSQYPFFDYYIKKGSNFVVKCKFISIILASFLFQVYLKFYMHQYFAFILIFISYIINFISLKNKNKIYFILMSLFIKSISSSLSLYIFKYLNEIEYINIYLLGSIDGLIYIINIILIDFIRYILCFDFLNFNNFIRVEYEFFILFLIKFFEGFFSYYIIFTIIKILNPIYVIVFDVVILIFSNITLKFDLLIPIILELVGILIFMEILIINCFGLGKNVEENIKKRAIEQYNSDIEFLNEVSFNNLNKY